MIEYVMGLQESLFLLDSPLHFEVHRFSDKIGETHTVISPINFVALHMCSDRTGLAPMQCI